MVTILKAPCLFLQGRLLQPDHHPLHHPRLLYDPHRQPTEEEDRR